MTDKYNVTMVFRTLKALCIILLIISTAACQPKQEEVREGIATTSRIEQAILKVNRYMARRNLDHIRSFVRRTGWDMSPTGSGLWIMIEQQGTGEFAKPGQIIKLGFTMMLMDGTDLASSGKNGPLEFRVGQGGVPAGLDEAAGMLKNGSRAKIIIPPHLAYGNFGDNEERIPPDAILIYELEVLSIR